MLPAELADAIRLGKGEWGGEEREMGVPAALAAVAVASGPSSRRPHCACAEGGGADAAGGGRGAGLRGRASAAPPASLHGAARRSAATSR
eukprot:gene18330-27718_t